MKFPGTRADSRVTPCPVSDRSQQHTLYAGHFEVGPTRITHHFTVEHSQAECTLLICSKAHFTRHRPHLFRNSAHLGQRRQRDIYLGEST